MKYLCLIYEDEKAWQGMSKADMDKGLGEYRAFGDSIRQDAVQVAARIPGAKHGTVEVRPIMEFSQP